GKVDYVGHQRQAASVTVGQQAEQQRPHRTHGQSARQRGDDRALAYMKLCSQRVVEKDNDEEVEGVERPAQKTGGDGMSGAWRVRHAMADRKSTRLNS